jgi:tRNA dimethylallyltransferase
MSVDAVLIAGPTASGKSAAALALAERLGGIVINADSMQVYREARILTARPGDEDLARAPHRLYGHVGVGEAYSVARYQADATDALAEARAAGRMPIFTGGTGLYFGALTEGLADIPAVPASIRANVQSHFERVGADAFFAELRHRDPEIAQRLRASDRQRVLRAYEVFEATGRKLSEWQRDTATPPPLAGFKLARVVIAPPRPELHRRIAARFDAMVEAGALEEAAALEGLDPAWPAAKILGLRELRAVRAGTLTLDDARSATQATTRQYAKRQLTWARQRMANWIWVESANARNFISEILPHLA